MVGVTELNELAVSCMQYLGKQDTPPYPFGRLELSCFELHVLQFGSLEFSNKHSPVSYCVNHATPIGAKRKKPSLQRAWVNWVTKLTYSVSLSGSDEAAGERNNCICSCV